MRRWRTRATAPIPLTWRSSQRRRSSTSRVKTQQLSWVFCSLRGRTGHRYFGYQLYSKCSVWYRDGRPLIPVQSKNLWKGWNVLEWDRHHVCPLLLLPCSRCLQDLLWGPRAPIPCFEGLSVQQIQLFQSRIAFCFFRKESHFGSIEQTVRYEFHHEISWLGYHYTVHDTVDSLYGRDLEFEREYINDFLTVFIVEDQIIT